MSIITERFPRSYMRKCFKIIAIIICFSVLSSLLTACSSEQNEYDQSAVIFTDALGREVSVPKEPERVAALIGSFADVWMLAGGSVCATAEDAWDDFGLALPDAVNIGGAHSPNLELIFSVNPDFVIASASTSSNVEMKETLEAAGIAVAYFDVDNFSDYLAMLDICTDITERKDLYECNGLAIQSQIEDIKQAIEERAPYRIFVVTMGDDTEKAIDNLNQMMNENPAWGTLDAVAEGRLHLMERKLFNIKPNADWAESYEKLSEILLTE